jgi:hypothetical protein
MEQPTPATSNVIDNVSPLPSSPAVLKKYRHTSIQTDSRKGGNYYATKSNFGIHLDADAGVGHLLAGNTRQPVAGTPVDEHVRT